MDTGSSSFVSSSRSRRLLYLADQSASGGRRSSVEDRSARRRSRQRSSNELPDGRFAQRAGSVSSRSGVSNWTNRDTDFAPRDETLAFPSQEQRGPVRAACWPPGILAAARDDEGRPETSRGMRLALLRFEPAERKPKSAGIDGGRPPGRRPRFHSAPERGHPVGDACPSEDGRYRTTGAGSSRGPWMTASLAARPRTSRSLSGKKQSSRLPAPARVHRHDFGSRGDRAALTGPDRRVVRSEQRAAADGRPPSLLPAEKLRRFCGGLFRPV